MHTHFELLRHMLILISVRLVVLPPLRERHFLVQQHPLFQKLEIVLTVGKGGLPHVFEILFDVDILICAEVDPVYDLPSGFFGLLTVDGCKFVHLLQMLSQHFSLKGGHSSQKAGRVASPNFSFLDFHPIQNNSPGSHKPPRVHSSMTHSCPHSYVGVIFELGTLENRVGANKNIVAYGCTFVDVHSVLQNGVVSHFDRGSAYQGGTVPH